MSFLNEHQRTYLNKVLSVKSSHSDGLWAFYVVAIKEDTEFSSKNCLCTTLEAPHQCISSTECPARKKGFTNTDRTSLLSSPINHLSYPWDLALPSICSLKTDSLQKMSVCCHWADFREPVFGHSFQKPIPEIWVQDFFVRPRNQSDMYYFKSFHSSEWERPSLGGNSTY